MNERVERLRHVAEDYVAAGKFSGIEWQVEVRGEVLSSGRAGWADAITKQPLPDAPLYRIYSMTKPVVSVLALRLIEQGKLRFYDMLPQLDSRFAQLRVLTPDGQIAPLLRPVTVEDLLTHRAGFTYDFMLGCHIAPYYREAEIVADGSRSLDAMMAALAEQPLAFQPGSSWRYSVCTDVLAHACVCATGRALDDLLAEYVFTPLGMQDTGFTIAADQQHRLMPMFGVGDLTAMPRLDIQPQVLEALDVDDMHPLAHPDFQRGGHGLYATLADYQAFARVLLDGRSAAGEVLLSRKMLEMLQANRIPASQLPLRIGPNVLSGYGWGLLGRVMLDAGQVLALSGTGEFGWAGAASTFFWVDPQEQMTGVVMTQYLGASLPLGDDMRAAAYQALP